MDNIYFGSEVDRTHPLALLASELKIIAERELSMYYPVLCHWYPQAGIAASIRLHRFYGEKLVGSCLELIHFCLSLLWLVDVL